jgi:glucose-1-phosphate adenylyltransferase
VAVTEVPEDSISSFGILETDPRGRVVEFKEKPRESSSRLASMGVYLFDREALVRWLIEDAQIASSTHDFGKDILPRVVAQGQAAYAYRYGGYWQDVGTLDSYFESNMALLDDHPPMELNDPGWVMHTQSADRPPVRFESGCRLERSLVANGCRVEGEVTRSVLFPGVWIAAGAVVRDSIVMHDSHVGEHAVLDRAILDKEVEVGRGARLGFGEDLTPNRACPEHLTSGLTLVGKGARIPEDLTVGRNVRIGAGVLERDIGEDIVSGGVVHGPDPEH